MAIDLKIVKVEIKVQIKEIKKIREQHKDKHANYEKVLKIQKEAKMNEED